MNDSLLEKLNACINHDACEKQDCIYYVPEREMLQFLSSQNRAVGEWVYMVDGYYQCTACNGMVFIQMQDKYTKSNTNGYRFCPRCGAEMKRMSALDEGE